MVKKRLVNSNLGGILKALVLISILVFVIFLFPSPTKQGSQTPVTGYFSKEGTVYTCSSCADCTAAIADASAGDTVQLNTSVTNAVGSCINFDGKDDITFDCQSHDNFIDGDDSSGDYGIWLGSTNGGSNNSIVRNCNVSGFSGSSSVGIMIQSGNNNTLTNIISNDNYYGVYLVTSSTNNTLNSVILNSNYLGVWISGSKNNILINVTANYNTPLDGIKIGSSTNTTITDSTANYNTNNGVYISGLSGNSVLSGNNLSGNYNYDLEMDADLLTYLPYSIDSSNIIDYSKRIYFNRSISDYVFNPTTAPDAGMLVCLSCDNVTYENFHLAENNSEFGVFFYDTNNSKIDNVTTSNNKFGIKLTYSFGNNLSNIISNISAQSGILLKYISSNNSLSNITVVSSNLHNIDIQYIGSTNTLLDGVVVSDSATESGLRVSSSSNTISNVVSTSNSKYGVYLSGANSNVLTNVTSNSNSLYGIYVSSSSGNNLTNISSESNGEGIRFFFNSQNNTLIDSYIRNNSLFGLRFQNSSSNMPQYNNIYNSVINNTENYYNLTGLTNYFNTTLALGTNIVGGPYIGGNYWDNYSAPGTLISGTCTDANSNGICDDTYNVDGISLSYDYLPLTTQVPDSTAPAVTINSPTNTTYTSSTITLNVTATDASSSVSSCWYTLDAGTTNYTLTNSGDDYTLNHGSLANSGYTAQFYCNDTSNNVNNTEAVSFTVEVVAAEGGGTTGGGGVTAGQPTSTLSFPTVTTGTPVSTIINNAEIDVTKLTVTTNQDLTDASITITTVDVLPQADIQIGLPGGTAYQAFQIDLVGFDDTNIDEVILEFKVNKTWLITEGGTSEQIALFRKQDTGNQWDTLPTTITSEDADFYYFSAVSPGFSEFTIFLLSGQNCVNPGESRCNGDLVQLCLANYEWRNIKQCANGCFEGECINPGLVSQVSEFFSNVFSQKGLLALSAVIIIISFGVVVVVYILVEKRKEKKSSKKK